MKSGGGISIKACLARMSGLAKQAVSQSDGGNDPKIDTLVKTLDKLSAAEFPTEPDSYLDPRNDSLQKVSHYIELAQATLETVHSTLSEQEQQQDILLALGETFEALGNYDAALKNYQSTFRIVKTGKDQSLQGRVQYRMARIYSEMGEWKAAQDLLHKSISTLDAAGQKSDVALAQIELGAISYRKGEYHKARETLKKALQACQAVNDIPSSAIACNRLGTVYRILGEYDKAHTHFHQALIEFQSIQNSEGAAESLNNLGLFHFRQNQLKQAITYYDKSLKLCHEMGHFPLSAFVFLNKAGYFLKIGDHPVAATHCCCALERLVRLKNPIGIAKADMIFGRILWKSGDLTTAEAFYRESLGLYRKFRIPLGLANCSEEFATMLSEIGRPEEAAEFTNKADELYSKLNIERQRMGLSKKDR